MYTQLASRLHITSTNPEVSQAVATAGSNAASVETTIFSTAGDVTIKLQGSNDLENWTDLDNGTMISTASAGYHEGTYFDSGAGVPYRIAFAYVRLSYTVNHATGAILAAGINLFSA